jgi:hypothetical protein
MPAGFLSSQNIFLPFNFLAVDAIPTIKRLIVQVFHRRMSACCCLIVIIMVQGIASIVTYPFASIICTCQTKKTIAKRR